MKRLVNSLVIAFSMYSKLPMPRVEWEKENMQYAMCFFPLIGAVIGGVDWLLFLLLKGIGVGTMFQAAILAVVPILITGGIHMDGYLDTIDALSSYGEREKKLEILKDPHTGAFAIIYAVVYGIVLLGGFSELVTRSAASKGVLIVMLGFVLSRACSGLSVVTLKSAKTSGLLAMFQSAAKKRFVTIIMAAWIILVGIVMCIISIPLGLLAVATAAIMFMVYRHVAYSQFGGVTGDLAGFFLTLCELAILIVIMIGSKIL